MRYVTGLKMAMTYLDFVPPAPGNAALVHESPPMRETKYSKRQVGKEDRKLTNAFCMIRYLNFPLRHLFFPGATLRNKPFILLCIKVLKGMKKLTNFYF